MLSRSRGCQAVHTFAGLVPDSPQTLQLLHVREKSTPPDIVLEAAGRVAAELAKLFHLLQKIQSILHVLHLKLQTLRHKVTEGKLPKAVKEAENLIRKPLEVGGLQ